MSKRNVKPELYVGRRCRARDSEGEWHLGTVVEFLGTDTFYVRKQGTRQLFIAKARHIHRI